MPTTPDRLHIEGLMFETAPAPRIVTSHHTRLIAPDLGDIPHMIGQFHGGRSEQRSQTDSDWNYSKDFSLEILSTCERRVGIDCQSQQIFS
jgi:hypothetical protein